MLVKGQSGIKMKIMINGTLNNRDPTGTFTSAKERQYVTIMKLCICTCMLLYLYFQQSMKDRIMAIRESKEKTKVAHFFACDIQNDKSTREACMIKAIGKLDGISGYYMLNVYTIVLHPV